MDYTDVLRLLAINDARFGEECAATGRVESASSIRRRWRSSGWRRWSRSAASEPSYGAEADAAVNAGATAAEIVDVLVGVVPVVGLPCVVAAAPKLAMALGYDIDEALGAAVRGSAAYPPSRPIAVACSTASLRDDTPSFR